VVLTDFGIATLEGDPSLTSTGLLLGAPAYIAPERARGLTPGPASDLWSLGATLFTALEGRPPYDRGSPLATLTAMISEDPPLPDIDGPLGTALDGLLQRDPDRRMNLVQARTLLQQAREATAGPSPEPLSATLATPVPTAPDHTGEDAIAVADRTQVVHRPESAVPSETKQGLAPLPAALLAALAALVVSALVAITVLSTRDANPPDDQRAGGTGPTPSAANSARASSAPATQPPATASPPATAGQLTPGVAPAGYTLYRDRSGFSVAVPDGWVKGKQDGDSDDGQFDFVDPTSRSRFLRFGYTTSPKSDPVADWEQQEQRLRAREPGYRRISIEAVDYRDYLSADWDFAIGGTRVKDRGFKVDSSHGYAIYVSAPQSQFADAMKHFEVAAGTFTPAR